MSRKQLLVPLVLVLVAAAALLVLTPVATRDQAPHPAGEAARDSDGGPRSEETQPPTAIAIAASTEWPGGRTATGERRPVFATPLLATGRTADASEDAALAVLATDFLAVGGPAHPASAALIADHLQSYPNSPYALTLLQEQAAIEWRHGWFMQALDTLQEAWHRGRSLSEPDERRLAEAALSDLLTRLHQLGRRDELQALIEEVSGRPMGGSAAEALWRGKELLWFLENQAEQNVFCGFTAANAICVPAGFPPIFPDVHDEEEEAEFIAFGLSLYELREHSHEGGGDLAIYRRTDPSAPLPVPAVVHFDFEHYAAVTESVDGRYRLVDEQLRFDSWVEPEALERHFSGYVLVTAATPLPPGYVEVDDDEAKSVYGRHCNHGRDDEGQDEPFPGDERPPNENDPGACPMAAYRFSLMNPGLIIVDTPVSYQPAFGPPTSFRVQYSQRSTVIPDLQQQGNFGPRWTYNFSGHIELLGTGTPNTNVRAVFGDGVFYRYTYATATGSYTSKYVDRPRLDYLDAAGGGPGFRLLFADRSEFRYTTPNSPAPTRFLLTEVRDPRGNSVSLGYDEALRLVAITDALGLTTTVSYTPEPGDGVPGDLSKIRAISDPFGRTATFRYTTTGQLRSITDPIGILSEFTYATGDFIDSLTTPYGTTTFAWGELRGINQEPGRFIEATDPDGDRERAEANDFAGFPAGGVDPFPAPTSINVAGQAVSFLPKNNNLFYRNTYYWTRQMMREGAGDYSRAIVYNWKAPGNIVTGLLNSYKNPLEGRIWFNYSGQTSVEGLGKVFKPSKIVRAIEGPTQVPTWTMEQNDYDPVHGLLRRSVDRLGREMIYEYNDHGDVPGAVKDVDLTAIKVRIADGFQTIARFSHYVSHQPTRAYDAAGFLTTFTFNDAGQITSITNPLGETTAFVYHETDAPGQQRRGRLARIEQAAPLAATLAVFGYDAFGNVASVTGPDGHFVAFTYDALDRITRFTYPDGTYEELTYRHLDPEILLDRLGRATLFEFDHLRRPYAITDPAGRTTRMDWCPCGGVNRLVDPMGRETLWHYDLQGRLTGKTYPDGSTVELSYQPSSGRLHRRIDERGFATLLSYHLDDTLHAQHHPDSQPPTPSITFAYDPFLLRPTRMTDGTGDTIFTYHPLTEGAEGAGQVASMHRPATGETIAYSYDPLGRRVGHTLNGSGETLSYDALGRITRVSGPLGVFDLGYHGATERLATLAYPNGMLASYQYHPLEQDFRLREITHTLPGPSLLARFAYEQDVVGNILRWTQSIPAAGLDRSWTIEYDDADQVTAVDSQHPVTLAPLPAGHYSYTYDPAGNRLTETIDGVTTTASYNALNQLVSLSGPGSAGLPDLTYEWDANHRLLAVEQPAAGLRSQFTYDGLGRRRTASEFAQGQLVAQTRFAWESFRIIEEQDAPGPAVARRIFSLGMSLAADAEATPYYFARDHLGSVRAVLDASAAVAAAIDYDPWGRHSILAGQDPSRLAFTGHWHHIPTGLAMAPFRSYAPWTGQWLNRDPAGEDGGLNLYAYALNNPLSLHDPLGLWAGIDDLIFAGGGAVIGVGGRFVGDLFTGNRSSWQDYTGAAVGGATAGMTLLYTANPFLAGAAGGLAGNLTTQGLNVATGRQCNFDAGSALFDTGFGAATGFIPGRPRIQGINAGRGSDVAVFRQMVTKFRNGTISNVTPRTAMRMSRGAFYEYAAVPGAAASAAGSTGYNYVFGP
ncbi:MAG: RHS repeat protein [Puniceicoccaceae bacterium]|nr:MAG: RHS repeat protein [Puniceicoccaceae bacterium]